MCSHYATMYSIYSQTKSESKFFYFEELSGSYVDMMIVVEAHC